MIRYKNLYLIGTSHISKESVEKVNKVITKLKPEIIALELDKDRFNAIITVNKRKILSLNVLRTLGLKGFLLNLIGSWFERKLGKKAGTEPGSEMKKAIELAKLFQSKIYLIDQDIKITLKKFLSSISRTEKIQFLKDLIFGDGLEYDFNLDKVPSQNKIDKLIKNVKKKYPSFYTIVIKERNEFMAKNLYKVMQSHKEEKIVCIVGAGHEKSIVGELKSLGKI